MQDILDFKLDPPRGKTSRTAVVLISSVDTEGFQMHKQEYVEPGDSEAAVVCFRKLRLMCTKINSSDTEKRSHALGDQFGAKPTDLKRCRTLQNMPTDGSM